MRKSFVILVLCLGFQGYAQVGVGTTTPTAQLTVNEDGIFNESGGAHDFRVESDGETHMFYIDGTNNQMFIRASNQHLGYIDPLNVYANSSGSSTIGIQYAISGWNQGNQGGGGNFVIEDASNVFAAMEASTEGPGISVRGLSPNSDAIGVLGTIDISGPGSWLGYGGAFFGGLAYANGVYNLSDERAKKNIVQIDNALDKLLNIGGYSYNYDQQKFNPEASEDPSTYYGFLAQNVKEFLPHAVRTKRIPFEVNKKRNPFTVEDSKIELMNVVDYTAIVPVTVEAIKEQQELIKSQKLKIKDLEQRLMLLESKMNTLLENSN